MNEVCESIEVLREVTRKLDLIAIAKENAESVLGNEDLSHIVMDDLSKLDEVTLNYKFLKICLKSERLDYPYFEVQVDLIHKGAIRGHYTLYTLLNGQIVDDALIFP